jgi:hypothetical protein
VFLSGIARNIYETREEYGGYSYLSSVIVTFLIVNQKQEEKLVDLENSGLKPEQAHSLTMSVRRRNSSNIIIRVPCNCNVSI